MRYEYEIFADYFHFYVEDSELDQNSFTGNLWNEVTLNNKVSIKPGLIAVGTERNMVVKVILEIADSDSTEINLDDSDHIIECGIEVSSGQLIIMGTTDYYPTANRINVPPNTYKVIIFYQGLGTISEDGLEGNDTYKLLFIPSSEIDLQQVRLLKKYTP